MELKNFYAQDVNGNIVPGAACTVYLEDRVTLATGLQDAAGAALANPFTADVNGLAQFAAPNGKYYFRCVAGLLDSQIAVQFADPSAIYPLITQAQASANSAATSAAAAAASAAAIVQVPDYAALRAYTGSAAIVRVTNPLISGDFPLSSVAGTDNGGTVIVDTLGRTRRRNFVGEYMAEWFEPVDGAAVDSSLMIQKAVSTCRANGGGTVRYSGRYLIDQDLYVNDYVHLMGTIEGADELLDGAQAYSSKASTLVLNPTKTIYLESGAGHSDGLVIPKGMALRFPNEAAAAAGLASFAGTAFTARGAGTYLHNSTVWGFDLAFSSTNLERARVQNNKIDCNNGIMVAACFDVADISGNHFWPWLTTHRGFADSLNARPGTCILLRNVGDWNRVHSNFGYGYNRGLVIDSCDNVESINCGFDHIASLANTTSAGFEIKGTSRNAMLTAPQAAAQGTGIIVNTTADKGQVVTIANSELWDNDVVHVKVTRGYVKILAGDLRGGPKGIEFDGTSLGGTVLANRFDGITGDPIGGDLSRVSGDQNTYVNCTDVVFGVRRVSSGQFNNRIDQVFGSTAVTSLTRRAGGTIDAPTALADGATVFDDVASAFNGTAYNAIASIRKQTRGAQTTASAGGAIVVSTTPTGSTGKVDRWVFDQDGQLSPVGSGANDLGSTSNRVRTVNAVNADFTGKAKFSGLGNYATDAAAATGGVAIGEFYHNSGAIRVRLA